MPLYILVKPSSGQAHCILVGSHDLGRRNGHQEGVAMGPSDPGPALNFYKLIAHTWKLANTLPVTHSTPPLALSPPPLHQVLGIEAWSTTAVS